MKRLKNIFLFIILMMYATTGFNQCADPSNIYEFVYDGHSYEVVKENSTWTDAVNCAVSRNGYLAEITSVGEQNAIFSELTNNAGIVIANTQNQFGTASIWLGGTDAGIEGEWVWDGNIDGIGIPFWSGNANGSAVGGQYTNWGTSPAEPDNSGGQDHLTIIIKPTAVNFGLWNDLISTNTIYYLIEYDGVLSTSDIEIKSNVKVYPNPFKDELTIENGGASAITEISVFNLAGQKIQSFVQTDIINNKIDLSNLASGMYFLNVQFENGQTITEKISK